MFPSENLRFDSLLLSPALVEVTRELGFQSMTPVQAQSIPLIIEGRDLIAQSKTGSGKTAAFSLPILERLARLPDIQRQRHLKALVLCPTRELCTQVASEMRKLGRRIPGLQVLVVSGGQPMFSQVGALEKGVHVVVGTPGRVLDHLGRGTLDLREVATLVLDEADRMLEMGFEEDMARILAQTPESRQTVLFSATFPRTIEAMSRAYQKNPARITITEAAESVPDIRQVLQEFDDDEVELDKVDAFLGLLRRHDPESSIVFCNLKATVVELTRALLNAGVSAAGLQGDLEQRERDRVMARFRNQSTRVLVATDVAARGIDVEKLDLVLNFELPLDPEIYVHRIGRTGRAGQKGLAVTFASAREKAKVQRIEGYTGKKMEREPREVLATDKASNVSFDAKMETIFIAGGRKEKVRPGDILGALTGESGGLKASDIGKIEIHDHFSYVAVAKTLASHAVQSLSEGRIKGRRFRVGFAR